MLGHLEKLQTRLSDAVDRKDENKSENHWTATTWLLFFEDLNCRAIFDSAGNRDNDRPDIQVWLPKSQSLSPDIWVEAKPPCSFQSKRDFEKVHAEIIEKLLASLRHNQSLPKFILVTDFERTLVWGIDSFKRYLETSKTSPVLKALGEPIKTLKATNKSQFIRDLRSQFTEWATIAKSGQKENQPLDLDQLIVELLAVSTDFRKNFLDKSVQYIEKDKAVKTLFQEWLRTGGEITVETVNQNARKSNVGAEEAFAELCFHSVMVRCFAIKWFLDHGYLSASETATLWGVLDENSEADRWKTMLAPAPKSDAERVLSNLLHGSDVYLWIIDPVDARLWAKIKAAFSHYSLVAEKSDILGEFYQSYMQKYAKNSQKMLGQFYTPHRLTRAMWKLAGEIMREKGVSLADKSCLVIDPCVGTGTFLTQGLRLLLDGGWGGTKKASKGRELNSIFSRFTGFEINPLSRGVALVNALTEVLAHSSDGCKTFDPELRIFETNAYDIPDPKQQKLFLEKASATDDKAFRAWRNEILQASKAKAKNQYRIVIGNPPWKNPSPACKNERIQNLLKDEIMPWAWEYQGQKIASIKGCNHGIREDYVFFFGLGMRLLEERGLLVYVTSESWLNAPTYTMFRRHLLDNFSVHTVIRVGPYFDGVKERAAVVAFEKTDAASAGRKQKIRYLDWSDLSNKEWSKDWVNGKLQEFIDGDIKRTEFKTIQPVGEYCTIREQADGEFDNELPGLARIEDIFSYIDTGAQSGCGPLFLNTDKSVIEKRIKLLFQGKHSALVDEIADEVRGGKDKAEELVARVAKSIRDYGAKYERDAFRKIWAHFKAKSKNQEAPKSGYCYLDPRLWLFPRVAREAPDVRSIWDVKPKLVFRDIYDPDDKLILASVDSSGVVIDNHFFNGGVYVASVKDSDGNVRLSEGGKSLRSKFESDEQFLNFLAAILNSPQAKEWSIATPQERIKIPINVDAQLARKCAEVEAKLPPVWERADSEKLRAPVSALLKALRVEAARDTKARAARALEKGKKGQRKRS